MINSISSAIIPRSSLCCLKKWKKPANITGFKYVVPKKDVFVKETPEVLNETPCIQVKPFESGIKDDRLEELWVERRSFTYPFRDEEFPNEYICKDSSGKVRVKSHIYLQRIEVKPEFARQGVCSMVEQKLIEMAKNDEFEGRIMLNAFKMESPDMTQIPSPSLAHWKNGFRFADRKNNEIMELVLKGELPLDDAPQGAMYYPLS